MRARCFAILALASLLLCIPRPASGGTVAPGFDLFTTPNANIQSSLSPFPLASFKGLPLGTFNFGGSVGVQNVGATDTIIQRLASASSPGPSIIPIEIVALHLQSTAPINFGLGT